MFGQNPVAKREQFLDGSLTVVDGRPFYTIQGEGPYAGLPAVFLRLHGCPLRCYFCDTNFSSPEDPRLQVKEIVDMMHDAWPSSSKFGIGGKPLAVITGGEPTRQDLSVLVSELGFMGWNIQIETAGLFWQECLRDVSIVVSPKSPTINNMVDQHATCFKYIVRAGELSEDDGLPVTNTQIEGGKPVHLARSQYGRPVYLSPMDEGNEEANAKNRLAMAQSALKYGYRAGLQIHKFLELP